MTCTHCCEDECDCDKPVLGDRSIALKLHHWHHGMDAVYAVGSCWYDGEVAALHQVRDALYWLGKDKTRLERAQNEEDAEDLAELTELVEYLTQKVKEAEA